MDDREWRAWMDWANGRGPHPKGRDQPSVRSMVLVLLLGVLLVAACVWVGWYGSWLIGWP